MLQFGPHTKEIFDGEAHTTNNRMELMASIRALEALTMPCHVELHTDSTYVRNGITKWVHGWLKRGWKGSNKKPVKNKDLWVRLLAAAERHEVDWRWVKGHSGNPGNERADTLANMGMKRGGRAR